MLSLLLASFSFLASLVVQRLPPIVRLDNALFVGLSDGIVSSYLGVPFTQPPIGDLRLRLPVPVSPYRGIHLATAFGLSCPQQELTADFPSNLPSIIRNSVDRILDSARIAAGENCLTLNVIVPATASPESKLPVAVWIHGGGFQIGGTLNFDGPLIVNKSIALDDPIIYVSVNYRLNGFGFLASKEVQKAGIANIGLHDQREALRWIQKYISAFGGDPTKVTIWGQSAGSISTSYHLVANNGNSEGLFRGAFMHSGATLSVGPVTDGQVYYDNIVAQTNCSNASDTLDCLRKAPYDMLKAAFDSIPDIFSYQSLSLTWVPRVDGVFLTENPQILVERGVIANVPFVCGATDDEGTHFSLQTANITTSEQFKTYLQSIWLPNASDRDLDKLLKLYPDNVAEGSPFDTDSSNALSPQFKRVAAFIGDAVIHASRRHLLEHRSSKQQCWSFLSKRGKSLPFLGAVHGSDIANIYGGGELTDYLVRFVSRLDPNGITQVFWPKYTNNDRELLTFFDDGSTAPVETGQETLVEEATLPVAVTKDTFRKEAIDFVLQLRESNPN